MRVTIHNARTSRAAIGCVKPARRRVSISDARRIYCGVMDTRARYDEYAECHERFLAGSAAGHTQRVRALVSDLLCAGSGRCLDVGCGTGYHADLVSSAGWVPVGVDLSAGQLHYARGRLPVAVADAVRLPFKRSTFSAVLATHIHTDVDDWAGVCREVARVLAPGGRFVYVGAHPCFCGAFAERKPSGDVHLHGGYFETGLRFYAPGLSPHGIRARAGYLQRTLEAVLTPVIESGLRLTALREDADAPTPDLLGFRAER